MPQLLGFILRIFLYQPKVREQIVESHLAVIISALFLKRKNDPGLILEGHRRDSSHAAWCCGWLLWLHVCSKSRVSAPLLPLAWSIGEDSQQCEVAFSHGPPEPAADVLVALLLSIVPSQL